MRYPYAYIADNSVFFQLYVIYMHEKGRFPSLDVCPRHLSNLATLLVFVPLLLLTLLINPFLERLSSHFSSFSLVLLLHLLIIFLLILSLLASVTYFFSFPVCVCSPSPLTSFLYPSARHFCYSCSSLSFQFPIMPVLFYTPSFSVLFSIHFLLLIHLLINLLLFSALGLLRLLHLNYPSP